jgi:hypothetical protein
VLAADRSAERQKTDARVANLATSHDMNTYRVIHTRSIPNRSV